MTIEELRTVFTGQEVVYVYHDQIDARGNKYKTENEVFIACEEAVDEIARLIRRLTTSANTVHFIVTSDHGFIYKRDKLTGSDKINGIAGASDRYVLTENPVQESGVSAVPMKLYTKTDDTRFVNFPLGSDPLLISLLESFHSGFYSDNSGSSAGNNPAFPRTDYQPHYR